MNHHNRRLRAACAAGAVLFAAGALQSCAGAAEKLGLNSQAPDEFKVVSKAPLVVPPDYALRPPAPGEPRPNELAPESQARLALLGKEAAVQRSPGENLLVARAGGEKADPLVRYVVDDEFGSITHKEKSFADRVMFWKKDAPVVGGGANAAHPLDAAAEQQRVAKLTGGKTIIIARAPEKRGMKLPGL